MDITRLPVTPLGRPASAPSQGTRHAASVEAVVRPDAMAARPRSEELSERVVEGELLQRRAVYSQSTRSFLDERNLDHARPAGEPATSLQQSRLAISRYTSNIGREPTPGLATGRSLNYFV